LIVGNLGIVATIDKDATLGIGDQVVVNYRAISKSPDGDAFAPRLGAV
jgi:hypothetical protein